MRGRLGRKWQWLGRHQLAVRFLAGILAACAAVLVPGQASAQPQSKLQDAKVRVGFSNLVARLDKDEIGFAKAEYRVHILEALRGAGFNAVGAESLVFEKDEGQRAEYVLGGTVRELACQYVGRHDNCRVGIEWELLDRERDVVVYRAVSRYMERAVDLAGPALAGRKLTLGALADLMRRPRFTQLLQRQRAVVADETTYGAANFRACNGPERELPSQFNEVANGTFLVKQADGFGSGFGISPDGLVLTAAHVANGATVELLRRGETTPITGVVVRVARKHDVALIAVPGTSGSDQPCLDLQLSPPAAGDDIYAIGSPASQELAFSLTRGIVSALRLLEGVQLLQTDASLSPGNSGGPLLDRHARVVGIVTKKIAGHAVEGLGFGVQVQDALQALKLSPALATDASLLRPSGPPVAALQSRAAAFVDTETPLPSLDPQGDERRRVASDYQRRLRERAAATPWYVKPLRWVGLTGAIVGGVGIVYSTVNANQERITHADFAKYRAQNDASWAALALGTAAFAVSYPLEPDLPPPATRGLTAPPTRASLSLALGRNVAGLGLRLGL
jgi:serine protease Do